MNLEWFYIQQWKKNKKKLEKEKQESNKKNKGT